MVSVSGLFVVGAVLLAVPTPQAQTMGRVLLALALLFVIIGAARLAAGW